MIQAGLPLEHAAGEAHAGGQGRPFGGQPEGFVACRLREVPEGRGLQEPLPVHDVDVPHRPGGVGAHLVEPDLQRLVHGGGLVRGHRDLLQEEDEGGGLLQPALRTLAFRDVHEQAGGHVVERDDDFPQLVPRVQAHRFFHLPADHPLRTPP